MIFIFILFAKNKTTFAKTSHTKYREYKFFIIGMVVFVIFIFPLYWMIVTALKTQVEIFQIPTPLWPKDLTFDSFADQL